MKPTTWFAPGLALAATLFFVLASVAPAQPPASAIAAAEGGALFDQHCKGCHEPAVGRAPNRQTLAGRARGDIITALTSGAMAPMASGLNPDQIKSIAIYLTPGTTQTADRMCATNANIATGVSDWTSVGADTASTRFQPHPRLLAKDVPHLKVKWSFAMSGGGQSIVVGDWLFITNRNGRLYALDARLGCVHWIDTDVYARSTPALSRLANSPSGWALFVSSGTHSVRAFDAQSGKEIWKSEALESHPATVMTGAPVVAGDRLLVPVSSIEEVTAAAPAYGCCTFRGSLVALDLKTGAKLWQAYPIDEPRHPLGKNAMGVTMQGPAGGAIWSAPTVDHRRGLVYVATGDSYTAAETRGADAIAAIDLVTGKVRWKHQATAGDNFILGCSGSEKGSNCPNPTGPDYDFGASPILFTVPGGRQILVVGQKSGLVYGLDPDSGRGLWTSRVGAGSSLGGIEWGMAADRRNVFVANADTVGLFADYLREHKIPFPGMGKSDPARPGLTALDPLTGKSIWIVPAPKAPCHYAGDRSTDSLRGECVRAQSAPPAAMPGVVFSGTMDGWFRAYDATSGKILWAFSTTAQTYDTVNGVKGQPGGSIDGMGPVVADGMVFTMSGFKGAANIGGNATNVLLAFSVDGK